MIRFSCDFLQGTKGSQPPSALLSELCRRGSCCATWTAHCWRSRPPQDAAVRPVEAATRGSRSILSAQTSVSGPCRHSLQMDRCLAQRTVPKTVLFERPVHAQRKSDYASMLGIWIGARTCRRRAITSRLPSYRGG
jgi:hypothetical protein